MGTRPQPPSEPQGDEAGVIRIGVMSPTNSSHPGYVFLAELAREEINDHCDSAGLDYSFEFVYSCADAHATEAIRLTEWYHKNDVDLVIGYSWGSQMHGSMRNILKYNMTVITPTVDVYFWAGIWPNVIRLTPHSFRQVEPLARIMMDLGKVHTIIVHRNDNVERDFVHGFPFGNLTGFIEEYEALGGNVTHVVPYPPEFWQPGPDGYMMENERYLGEAEAAVQDSMGPGDTAVLLVDYSGMAEYLLPKVGEYPSLMNVTWFIPEFSSHYYDTMAFEEEAAQLVFLHPSLTFKETAVYDRVNAAHLEEFNLDMGYYSSNIYDACWLMALSVIEAGTSNATAVREAIMMVASNYTGASGSCAIDETYYRAVADYQIWGYFDTEDGVKRLECGLYNSTSKEITWNPFFISSQS